ncbi:MAG: translation elongation factor Ts [Patescibacteria group bacterium]
MSIKITTELVKELRDSTGISVMQCKKALEEAEGDKNKALAILKKTSSEIALKKAERQLNSGSVMIKTENNKSTLVALLCETDFVSKNQDFIDLLQKLTDKAISEGIEKMKKTAKDLIDPIVQKTGENIQLGDAFVIEGSVLGNYVHNNRAAVIVSLEGGTSELAKDIAMHIAAMKPEYISSDEIPEKIKKTMQEIFEKEVATINKPEDIKKKMLEGKINTYFKEKTLTEQPFIKNPEETIGKLLEKAGAKIKEVKYYSI